MMSMPTSKKAGMYYFGINEKWVIEKFTPKEMALFFKEGRTFFEYLKETKEAKQFLADHPEFAEVYEKW